MLIAVWVLAVLVQSVNIGYGVHQMRQPLAPPIWRASWTKKLVAHAVLWLVWVHELWDVVPRGLSCPLPSVDVVLETLPCLTSLLLFWHNIELERLWTYRRQLTAVPQPGRLTLDRRGLVVAWDARAQALLGWSLGELRGHSLTRLLCLPGERAMHHAGLRRWLHDVTPADPAELILLARMQHHDGTLLAMHVTLRPTWTAAGQLLAAGELRQLIFV